MKIPTEGPFRNAGTQLSITEKKFFVHYSYWECYTFQHIAGLIISPQLGVKYVPAYLVILS